MTALLHHDVLSAPGSSPTRSLFFLHGILGQGTNWRGFARQLVKQRPDWSAVLVDLRAHGDSRAVAGRDDLRGAAEDVTRLRDSLRLPVHGVLGHSFGGKVALRWMHDDPGALCRAFIVDSLPGARPDQTGSEGTMRVVEMLDALPPRFDSRDAFVAHVVEQGHSKALAAWLGQSLDRLEDGVRFGLDVGRIRALLDDYFATDLWAAVSPPPEKMEAHLVIGGRSSVYRAADRQKASELAEAHARLHVHVLEKADHWVHVDDPEGLMAIVEGAL